MLVLRPPHPDGPFGHTVSALPTGCSDLKRAAPPPSAPTGGDDHVHLLPLEFFQNRNPGSTQGASSSWPSRRTKTTRLRHRRGREFSAPPTPCMKPAAGRAERTPWFSSGIVPAICPAPGVAPEKRRGISVPRARAAPDAVSSDTEKFSRRREKRRAILRPRGRHERPWFIPRTHPVIWHTPGRSLAPPSSRSADLPGDRPRPAAKSQQGASARAGRWFPTHDAAVAGR